MTLGSKDISGGIDLSKTPISANIYNYVGVCSLVSQGMCSHYAPSASIHDHKYETNRW